MRLSESVSNAVDKLAKGTSKLEEVRANMPVRASTMHRLLGVKPTREQNRYGGKNPLPVDVMIVDETSMVDIHLMYQLVSALPDGCCLRSYSGTTVNCHQSKRGTYWRTFVDRQ